ncbi:MAG: 50S ribosomal protein L24 [Planctomycetota bacterium]
MAARIRKDDIVVVIAGDHRGARGKVLRVLPDKQRVVVEGVNMVYRHVRKSQRNPQGGRIQKEAPLHVSNVMPLDPKTDRPTRVRFEMLSGGAPRKRRIAAGRKASAAPLSEVTHAARKGGQR